MATLPPRKSAADVVISVATAGDMAVGKSSLIRCFCTGRLERHDYQSTTGVDIECKEFTIERPRQMVARMQLFDTAGQERFRAITPTFFRKRDGYIFVYDVTDLTSLQSVLDEWIPLILRHGTEGAQVSILGNKIDLRENNKQTSDEEADLIHKCSQKLAQNGSDVEHRHTSAVTGEGVSDAFTSLCERITSDKLQADAAEVDDGVETEETTGLWGVWDSISTSVGLKTQSDGTVDLNSKSENASVNQSQCCSG